MEDGGLEKWKAWTVAKEFTQVIGEDYEETYVSVAWLESVCLVCAIAASRQLRLWQIDFVSAFLNSDNTYDIYVEQPKGFKKGGDDHVWKLQKTLYGTMQGAHDWAKNLDKTFQGHGYYKLCADPQIQSRVNNDELTLTSTWTDDVLRASSTIKGEQLAKFQLGSSYKIKDLGKARLILGMHIDRNPQGDITLLQQAYCERLLKWFNIDLCSPTTTLLPPGLVLSAEDYPLTSDEVDEMKSTPFCEALGLLIWLQVATRPDLVYSINKLVRFAHNPGKAHWNALKHTLGYIKGTINYRIMYKGGGELEPIGYVDSDYAGCKDTRQSTEGNIFMVAGGPISWECKRQDMVALSTVEAEFMAFSRAMTQALWLSKYFDKVGLLS